MLLSAQWKNRQLIQIPLYKYFLKLYINYISLFLSISNYILPYTCATPISLEGH